MSLPERGWVGYGRPGVAAPLTPEQRRLMSRLRGLAGDMARVTTKTDIAASRAAGDTRSEWSDDTALAYLTAVLPYR